ncbi:MAG: M15 family metallopeptidase [Spirochaetia bacterium]|jgi:D-alanyl-D-alanine carboxypeptidase|nr:M15 family metallopeptidase [Spirochaetia bacterium]
MKHQFFSAALLFLVLLFAGCESADDRRLKEMKSLLLGSGMGSEAAAAVISRMEGAKERFLFLADAVQMEMEADPYLLKRVDKSKALPADYKPQDLLALDGSGLSLSRAGHRLRKPAFDALERMSRAAAAEGLTLLVSSTYRSYEYQKNLYVRNVAELGELEASRVSAAPGTSQHQLGTVVDFGSITDAFAETRAGRWLEKNAGRFGFSLSFPQGMEALTGYVWESWHYRYIGEAAASLQNEFFAGIQHNLMLFLDQLSRLKDLPAKR